MTEGDAHAALKASYQSLGDPEDPCCQALVRTDVRMRFMTDDVPYWTYCPATDRAEYDPVGWLSGPGRNRSTLH